MEFNVDDINIDNLELSTRGLVMSYALKGGVYDNLAITDEMFSWVLNPPPIYAAAGDDIKKRAEQHARAYTKNRPGSLKITRLVKKEFYDFLCTESEYYKLKFRSCACFKFRGICFRIFQFFGVIDDRRSRDIGFFYGG